MISRPPMPTSKLPCYVVLNIRVRHEIALQQTGVRRQFLAKVAPGRAHGHSVTWCMVWLGAHGVRTRGRPKATPKNSAGGASLRPGGFGAS
mmetsp:Transcript_67890/g.196506  ORF Transcript_67890/g.196506 Transcript_67890/m.196506 type:complete len:91 (+) Transcript_67890:2023-2295(+)